MHRSTRSATPLMQARDPSTGRVTLSVNPDKQEHTEGEEERATAASQNDC